MLIAQDGRHGHEVFLKADAVRPREQTTQVNDKLDIQEVASGGDEECGSATSLVMTMTSTIIGQHLQMITCRMRTVYQGGQYCGSGALCVVRRKRRAFQQTSIFILMALTRDESVYSLNVRPYQTASWICCNIPGARWLSVRMCRCSVAQLQLDRYSFGCGMTPIDSARSSKHFASVNTAET